MSSVGDGSVFQNSYMEDFFFLICEASLNCEAFFKLRYNKRKGKKQKKTGMTIKIGLAKGKTQNSKEDKWNTLQHAKYMIPSTPRVGEAININHCFQIQHSSSKNKLSCEELYRQIVWNAKNIL